MSNTNQHNNGTPSFDTYIYAPWTSNYLLINMSASRNCIFMSAEITAKNVKHLNILGYTVYVNKLIGNIPIFTFFWIEKHFKIFKFK